MGADFLFVTVPACELTDKRKDNLLEVIDNTEKENTQEWTVYNSLVDGRIWSVPTDEYKAILRKAVSDYETAREDREVAEWQPEGSPYCIFFAGGMCSGESPSEAFDAFVDLSNHPLIHQLLRLWAIEDLHKEGETEN